MELLELTRKTFELFNVSSIEELTSALLDAVLANNTASYDTWLALVEDPSIDWMQRIYQYHGADRTEHKQDFTPKSLAVAVDRLTASETSQTCLDLCAGTGALTIQKWTRNKNTRFICVELDRNVIPFLLFNLAARGINAVVLRGDALSKGYDEAWSISGRQCISISPTGIKLNADSCISNPPFNLKWQPPLFAQIDSRFARYGVPPKGNANFAFVLTALAFADRCALILPASVLAPSTEGEAEILSALAEQNMIDAAIICPDNMFESTSIGVCILVLDRRKQTATVEFVDLRQSYEIEVRDQNGQFGGASHTRRTYHKSVKVFGEQQLDQLCKCVDERLDQKELSACVGIETIRQNRYSMKPSLYIEFAPSESKHRDYADIVSDLNHIIRQRNACKLVINEKLARSFGLDKETMGNAVELDKEEIIERLSGQKLRKDDYIQFTKNKGELTFKANDPEILSSILLMIMTTWKQHLFYLNEEENRYLAELRDALLPDLMNGTINLSEEAENE